MLLSEPILESLSAQRSLADQAYTAIPEATCDGTLCPGERVTPDDIAKRLNLSRQPINTALPVLKGQGFLKESGRRGLAMVPPDPQQFQAIYEVRSAIEPLAVRLATTRLTPDAR
jgi:DNA-binding GntR family transcriptional regulator